MKTAGPTRDRCLRVRVSLAEEAVIYDRFPRRAVPALVRGWLLLEGEARPSLPSPPRNKDTLAHGRVLVYLQEVAREIEQADCAPIDVIKIQALLLGILFELERQHDS
jgi:hypothetical protein